MSVFLSWSVVFDEIMEDLVSFVWKVLRKVKAGEILAGASFVAASNFLFDYVLYAWVIYKYGLVIGGLIMAVLSALSCLVLIGIYDVTKRDWLGMEAVKEIGEESFVVSWFLKKGKFVQFIGLSFWKDPFITTAFLRKGKFNGLTMRDWAVFWASVLLSNGYWMLVVFAGINLALKFSSDAGIFLLLILHGYLLRRQITARAS